VVERAAASLTQPHLRVLTAEVQGLDVARRRLRTSAGEVRTPDPSAVLCSGSKLRQSLCTVPAEASRAQAIVSLRTSSW